ncbi:gamma-glutamyltransferase [Orrella marina]|uniref:Glutathione hydrolase proenzyme n=1 Tax=Orrella marina TaxID=2163011 RepID=A0A2R4XPB9_9BURK|nr:gamma-glutamyltransferase [Orrella marina]AWB35663.1 gamma-glutamyltransferase [Orrella marina]
MAAISTLALSTASMMAVTSAQAQAASTSRIDAGQTAQAVLNYQDRRAIFEPRQARYGMIASDHFLASQVGSDILAQGGNATDAAVATAFALAVVLPYAGNLGGGGFALIFDRDNQNPSENKAMIGLDQPMSTLALDFRESAPASAHPDLFLDAAGDVIPRMSIESTASIGVPGTVAGLLAMLERTGSLPRAEVIEPAIRLAEQGFEVTPTLAGLLASHSRHLYKSPANREVFFSRKSDSTHCEPASCPFEALEPLQIGDLLIQHDLANTLRSIRDLGAPGFYTGPVAQSISDTVNADTGQMSLNDLAHYRVHWREPVIGEYRDLTIASMAAPSSGGIHLIQMLNILSRFPMANYGYGSAASIHLMTEAARRAYADRAAYLGDPDFVEIPVQWLTSMAYAQALADEISLTEATPSSAISAGEPAPAQGTETTHLSAVDRWGNMVSLTTTLNLNFGSGWMAPGTGVLLNNEMDDFSSKPGVANAFGLIGSDANRIEPGKRPLSSMTPVIVFRDGQPAFATGTPGGARIITMVLQVILNVADHKMNIAAAGAVPRMHHQWLPDRIDLEPGFSPDTIRILQQSGHQVEPSRAAGRVQSVASQSPGNDVQNDDRARDHHIVWLGASDPRSADGAAIGPDHLRITATRSDTNSAETPTTTNTSATTGFH